MMCLKNRHLHRDLTYAIVDQCFDLFINIGNSSGYYLGDRFMRRGRGFPDADLKNGMTPHGQAGSEAI